MEGKKKVFFKVVYRSWGADKPYEAYFDNQKDAIKFYDKQHHVDKPRLIYVKREESIIKYKNLVRMTKSELEDDWNI